MLVRFSPRLAHVFCMLLPLLAAACGGDDDKAQTPPMEEENEGGAPVTHGLPGAALLCVPWS